jgi:hypothetical protein
MGFSLGGLAKIGGQVAQVGGAAFGGFGEDKDTAIKEALVQRTQARDDQKLAMQAALDRSHGAVFDRQAKVPIPGSAEDIAGKVATENALTPGVASRAAAVGAATIPTDVAKQTALLPGEVAKAGQTAAAVGQATIPSQVAAQAALLPGEITKAGQTAAAVGANTPERKQPVITTTTTPGGGTQQSVAAFGDKSGTVKQTGELAKAPAAGALTNQMVVRANAAIPQIDTALKTFDQYHEPGAAGRLFSHRALGGYAISPEGQRANQAADAIVTAYAGAKTRSGLPTMQLIQGLANQIKIQPGEGDNPAVVAAKIARAHAWRDELAQIGGNGGGGNASQGLTADEAAFLASKGHSAATIGQLGGKPPE